ncbi:MAG: hypothetical protein CUR32_00010 [Flavobacterium sp.]|nr:MAG: hypothetical protein CUR32_00045 [Flavobacterium sp.] [Flavobacterium sp. FEMGT703F]PJE45440.1 MAG: hypothetical protein CUR32_00010 [Flavobacterium sp.] [Flavobacterium sp. FEMGT703F]
MPLTKIRNWKSVAENVCRKSNRIFSKFALKIYQRISRNEKAESEIETGKSNWLRCVLKFTSQKMA